MKREVFLILIVAILLVSVGAWYMTGRTVDTQMQDEARCVELNVGQGDIYIDPKGVCAPCSDGNVGNITKPWCTLRRALNFTEPVHFSGNKRLYLREGIHRFDGLEFFVPENGLSGSPEKKTLISGYPGEKVFVHASERVQGWQKQTLPDGKNIWTFEWRKYLQEKRPKYLAKEHPLGISLRDSNGKITNFAQNYTDIPQAVFIDAFYPLTSKPTIIPQANETKTMAKRDGTESYDYINITYPKPYYSTLSRLNVTIIAYPSPESMPPGTSYYENDPVNPNYGKLFIKPPEVFNSLDPDIVPIEIPFNYLGFLGINSSSNVHITNFSYRYSNGFPDSGYDGGLILNGDNISIDNMDLSYHVLGAMLGGGANNIVRNSTISYNGATGSWRVGNNLTYDSNIFMSNGWRPFYPAWSVAGMKLIDAKATYNFTIRNNLFRDNGIGLWIDYTGDGPEILNGIKTWQNYVGSGHIIENNMFVSDCLALETSPGSETNPIIVRNNYFSGKYYNPNRVGIAIQSSPYINITNNIFVDLDQGILALGPVTPIWEPEYVTRSHVHNIRIDHNIFMNVSFPVIFGHDSTNAAHSQKKMIFSNDTSDFNVFYGGKKPNSYFKSIKENVDFSKPFTPLQVNDKHPLYKGSRTVASHVYDADGDPSNGIFPEIFLSAQDYAWFKARSIEELENGVFFTNGFLHSLNYRESGSYQFSSFEEWKTLNKNETNSLIGDPRLTSNTSYSVRAGQGSPAEQIGFKPIDFSRVVLSPLKIEYPQNNGKYNITSLSMNISYSGMPLRSCSYIVNEGQRELFKCDENVSAKQFSDRNNSWTASLFDELGSTRIVQTNFSVDTVAPNYSISPQNGTVLLSRGFVIQSDITDKHPESISYTLFNSTGTVVRGIVKEAKLSQSLGPFPFGKYYYKIIATDTHGNTNESPIFTLTLSEQPAQPPAQPPASGNEDRKPSREPTTFSITDEQLKKGVYETLIKEDALSIEINKKKVVLSILNINSTGMLVSSGGKAQTLPFSENVFIDLDKDGSPDVVAQVRFLDVNSQDGILALGKYIPLSAEQIPGYEPLIPKQQEKREVEREEPKQDEPPIERKINQTPKLPEEKPEIDNSLQKNIIIGFIIFVILILIVVIVAAIWNMKHKPSRNLTKPIYYPELK